MTVSLKIGERAVYEQEDKGRDNSDRQPELSLRIHLIILSTSLSVSPCCSFRGRNEFANHLSQSQNSHLSSGCPSLGLNYYNVHINIPEEEHCKFNHLTLRFASEGCCAGWSDCCASISSRFILMEASHCSQS